MSWLFSRALAEEYLQENSSDGELLRQWSGNPMPQAFLSPDRMTAFCRLSRFGMTFKLLTDDLFEDALMWFLEGFPAKTSALQEKAQELTESVQECGDTWHGSLARFDPVSCSWKTAQLSLLEDSEQCSVTWPRSGMTANGQCWELPMLGRRTRETDSGLWPTPNACTAANATNLKKSGDGRTKPNKLGWAVAERMWPTPTVCGNYNRKGASATSGDGLATAVRMWPTPQASDNRNRGTTQTPAIARRIDAGKQVMLSMCMNGPLNPTWVEWLMGWPLGWTDLKPLETDKFRNVQQQLGECLEACE